MTVSLHKTTYFGAPASVFERLFNSARDERDQVKAATSDFRDEPGSRYFLADDERSGFAIRYDGELVLVWSAERGRGDHLVRTAVMLGATYLDCFDGYLPSLYGRHGFVEIARESNWTPGEPDVVFMKRSA